MLEMVLGDAPKEVMLVEMQGTLTITSSDTAGDDVPVGSISVKDPAKPKKCTLHVGTQVVEGETSQLKRPVVVVRNATGASSNNGGGSDAELSRKRLRDEEERRAGGDEGSSPSLVLFEQWVNDERKYVDDEKLREQLSDRIAGAYEIVGVARQHFLFSGKPMRIFAKKP